MLHSEVGSYYKTSTVQYIFGAAHIKHNVQIDVTRENVVKIFLLPALADPICMNKGISSCHNPLGTRELVQCSVGSDLPGQLIMACGIYQLLVVQHS